MPKKADANEEVAADSSKNSEAELDVFSLETTYPDTALLFQSHNVGPASEKSVIVALDTNALLLPYQIKAGNVEKIGEVFKKLSGEKRLFVPGRVVREFVKNRDVRLAAIIADLNKRRSRLSGEMPPLLSATKGAADAVKAYEELSRAHDKYVKALDHLVPEIKEWRGDDPVAKVYADVFGKNTIVDLEWDEKSKSKYLREMEWRYTHKVPPGYKDVGKDDGGVGDFLIWKSLLLLAAREKKDIAFVTGEQKADWFVRADGGPIYPRLELIDEYRRASGGKSLRLMSLYELLDEMETSKDVVLEVKVAEQQANTTIALQRTSTDSGFISHEGFKPVAFVANRMQSFWAPAKGGRQSGTQLHGEWSVTNLSEGNIYISDVRVGKRDALFSQISVGNLTDRFYSSSTPIRPKEMARVVIDLMFFPPIVESNFQGTLVDDVVFVDNYEREHLIRGAQFRQVGT